MKKALVTGGSGFIGANLVRRLIGKNEVHLILREGSDTWRINEVLDKCVIHRADLSNRESLFSTVKEIAPDYIYHLAAYGAYSTQKNFEDFMKTNFTGAANLLDACAASGFSKFVSAGSSSEYGMKDRPMSESDVLEPNGLYGISKAAFTHYCMWKAKTDGLPITAFRLFAAYGPYEDKMRLFPSLLVPLLRKDRPKLGNPGSVRDFIFVDDVVDAFGSAAESKKSDGEILNLGTGIQHTVKDAADIACAKLGGEVEWGALDAKKRQSEPKSWVADMKKTFGTLNWRPKNPLEGGMEKSIAWYRDNLKYY
jgi:nucleoside-diphosphate-sugar epimerase